MHQSSIEDDLEISTSYLDENEEFDSEEEEFVGVTEDLYDKEVVKQSTAVVVRKSNQQCNNNNNNKVNVQRHCSKCYSVNHKVTSCDGMKKITIHKVGPTNYIYLTIGNSKIQDVIYFRNNLIRLFEYYAESNKYELDQFELLLDNKIMDPMALYTPKLFINKDVITVRKKLSPTISTNAILDKNIVNDIIKKSNSMMDYDEPITIKLRDLSRDEIFFKILKSTRMCKVFKTYADKKGIEVYSLFFLLDCVKIHGDEICKSLELEDGDTIDVILNQIAC